MLQMSIQKLQSNKELNLYVKHFNQLEELKFSIIVLLAVDNEYHNCE